MRVDDRPVDHRMKGVLAELERNGSRSDVARRYWEQEGAREASAWPPREGHTNWIWLTDLEPTERVIDLGSPLGRVAMGLAPLFPEVTYLSAPCVEGRMVRSRFDEAEPGIRVILSEVAGEAPKPGSVDCVSFEAVPGWRGRVPAWIDDPGAVPGVARRWLRTGGWFACLVSNPLWVAREGDGSRCFLEARSVLRAVKRGMRAAGFHGRRTYLSSVAGLVPRERLACRRFLRSVPSRFGRLPTPAVAHASWLFPELLLLGRR